MLSQPPEKPSGSFADRVDKTEGHLEQAPDDLRPFGDGRAQYVQLFVGGASMGWLGEDSRQWCVIDAKQDTAVTVMPYVWNGVVYYRHGGDPSRYLSVSGKPYYVGFF